MEEYKFFRICSFSNIAPSNLENQTSNNTPLRTFQPLLRTSEKNTNPQFKTTRLKHLHCSQHPKHTVNTARSSARWQVQPTAAFSWWRAPSGSLFFSNICSHRRCMIFQAFTAPARPCRLPRMTASGRNGFHTSKSRPYTIHLKGKTKWPKLLG